MVLYMRKSIEAAIDEVELPLSNALYRTHLFGTLGWLDADIQLTYPQCGLATAVLQIYLEQEGFTTQRMTRNIPAPPIPSYATDSLAHVVLRSEDVMIDPTYTQFYAASGLSSGIASYSAKMKALYPEKKIAVIRNNESADFGCSFAKKVIQMKSDFMQLFIEEKDSLQAAMGDDDFPRFDVFLHGLEQIPATQINNDFLNLWELAAFTSYELSARPQIETEVARAVFERLKI